MSTLTPTVKLNSFAMARQITPLYREITAADTKSDEKVKRPETQFKFSLTFEEFLVEGAAKTKQKAKHDAAQKMIEKLKEKYPQQFAEKLDLDQEDKMLLMLAEKKLTPIYQYVCEEGSSENRLYTVRCIVGTLVVEGKGKGKKSARVSAAKQIIQYFKSNETLPEVAPADQTSANKCRDIKEKLEGCPFSDPISVLQEYLVHNNLDPPSYSTSVVDKVYTITGKAGGISYGASARNKKLAKQCAAAGVLEIIGVKERPKKKPKKKGVRTSRSKFRYLAPQQVKIGPRQFGFEGMFTRPKIYEPSQRALNFSRRNPEEDPWMSQQQQRQVQSYYDIF